MSEDNDDTLDIPLSGNWDASTLPAPAGREHEPDPGHTDEQLKELLFASYDESVMWRRVYPPRHQSRLSSYFGGLPSLGDRLPWPRSHDDSASLMFVGQIDLAHLPDFSLRASLPEAGILFFFFGIAHGESPTPQGKVGKVIFDPSASGASPQRQAPADRMPRYADYPADECGWVDRKGMGSFKYHQEFPRYDVEPVLCRFFADHHPTYHWGMTGGRYQRLWKRAQSQEIVKQLGRPYGRWWPQGSEGRRMPDGSLHMDESKIGGAQPGTANLGAVAPRIYREPWFPDDAWPYSWLFIEIAMAELLQGVGRATNNLRYQSKRRPQYSDYDAGHLARYGRVASAATEWLERARRAGSYDPVPGSEREAFRRWVTQIGEREPILDPEREAKREEYQRALAAWRLHGKDPKTMPRPREEGPRDAFYVETVKHCLSTSLMRGVELSQAESAEAAAQIPFSVVEFFRWRHAPLRDGGSRFIRHQLLGPPRTMQNWSKDLAQARLLLMQFDTDEPMHWMWGDMGVLQYWITREDLKARRFEKVKVTMGA